MASISIEQILRDNLVYIVAAIAVVALVFNIVLSRRIKRLRVSLGESRAAAEESARLAALAHPGGIDPEAVIEVLRRGIPPTLENVYSVMRRREAVRDHEPAAEEEPATSTS